MAAISEGFPTPRDLIQHELRTLEVIDSKTHYWTYYPDLCEQSRKQIPSLQAQIKQKRHCRHALSFFGKMRVETEDRKPGVVYVGANIKADASSQQVFDELNYHFYFAKANNPNTPIRKIHFDFAAGNSMKTLPPVFHLQVGGKPFGGLDDKHLFPELSQPRIACTPMSLALLINMVFSEFPDNNSDKAMRDSDWRGVVRASEELVLHGYFSNCNGFINANRNSAARLLTCDYYYEQ